LAYGPKTLENIEVDIVLGQLVVDAEIGVWRGRGEECTKEE
jgi:hypothetical protein